MSAATESISEDSKNLIHPFTRCKVSNEVTNTWSTCRAQLQLLFTSASMHLGIYQGRRYRIEWREEEEERSSVFFFSVINGYYAINFHISSDSSIHYPQLIHNNKYH